MIEKMHNSRCFRSLISSKRKLVHFLKVRKKYHNKQNCNNLKSVINVGFIVQLSSIWEKQVTVFEEMNERATFKTFLFVVPDYNFLDNDIALDYCAENYFLAKYSNAIKIFDDEKNIISLRDYDLDYLFYPRPYDHYLPAAIRSTEMSKFTKCCYIPYGISGADIFNGGNVYNSFFENIYFCFMDSSYSKELLSKEYRLSIKRGYQRVEYFGYPALDNYLDFPLRNEIKKIVAWTPRWSYDSQIGGSNFIEYKDDFVNMLSDDICTGIFRPHPLMFDELERKGIFTKQEKMDYLEKLRKSHISMDIDSPIDYILHDTDILITDFSSIIIQFFVTNRPIIYCDKGIKVNILYEELLDYMYVAYNWDDVKKYFSMLVNGSDPKRELRTEYINRKYRKYVNSKVKIVDAIEADYRRKTK